MTREEAIRLLSGLMFNGKLKEALDMAIKALEQESKWDRLYSWLNDMWFSIAPDETTPYDERNERLAQVYVIDDIMEWMVEPQDSEKVEYKAEDCISRKDALRVAKNEYLRGWHNALCKALSEKYSIHCEEGNFSVIQEETITGLGLSMNCALGKDVESYMSTLPSVTPQEPKIGRWIEKAEDYYKAINEYGGGVDENTDYFTDDIACPKCLSKFSTIDNETERFRHCPNCGAKMEK
jgi:hypothetical protein